MQCTLATAWGDLHGRLTDAFQDSEAPTSSCSRCGAHQANIISCLDCGPRVFYCDGCNKQIHESVFFHKPYIWKDGCWIPDTTKYLIEPDCTDADCSSNVREVTVIDQIGREHAVLFRFCACRADAESMVRMRLWPTSPTTPRVGVHFAFMERLRCSQLEGHESVMAAIEATNYMFDGRIQKARTTKVYKKLINESFHRYKAFVADLKNADSSCPACPQDASAPVIIAMDGNAGLVRRLKAGQDHAPEATESRGSIFLDQDEVDAFVNSYPHTNKRPDTDCNEFNAGHDLRPAGRRAKLDEEGVFASVCRHEVPVSALSLKHPERMAYPVFLLEKLAERFPGGIHLMYDIACLMEGHLKKHSLQHLLDNVHSFSVPVFHSYAHNRQCQIEYSPRRTPGIGMTDGETTERLWSYLRPFARTTKEMTPMHRRETLEHGINHYTEKRQRNILCTMKSKLERAEKESTVAKQKFQQLCEDYQVVDNDVLEWMQSELDLIKQNKSGDARRGGKKSLLQSCHDLAVEHRYLLDLKKKNASGQKIAIRLEKRLLRTSKNLKKLVSRHDATANYRDFLDPDFASYDSLSTDGAYYHHGHERELIDALHRSHRADEELALLSVEKDRVLAWLRHRRDDECERLTYQTYTIGARALSLARYVSFEKDLEWYCLVFGLEYQSMVQHVIGASILTGMDSDSSDAVSSSDED